jgi:subtilisin family serine protease
MAPGDDLFLPTGEAGYSVSKGTSWSCAIGSGIAALLLQINPKLTPAAIKQLLIETAHTSNGGRARVNVVDAYAAARSALDAPAVSNPPSATTPSPSKRRSRKSRR